jgi:hypothetical protein
MFSVCFPLAPAFAMACNYFEFSVDLLKFATCRRPLRPPRDVGSDFDTHDTGNIGVWAQCLDIIGFLSIFTNLFILSLYFGSFFQPTEALAMLPSVLSTRIHIHVEAWDAGLLRFVCVVLLEHVILLMKVVLMAVIPKETTSTKRHELSLRKSSSSKQQHDTTSLFSGGDEGPRDADGDRNRDRDGVAGRGTHFAQKIKPMLKTSQSIRSLKAEQERMYEDRLQTIVQDCMRSFANEKIRFMSAHAHTDADETYFQLLAPLLGVTVACFYYYNNRATVSAWWLTVSVSMCVAVYVCVCRLHSSRRLLHAGAALVSDSFAVKTLVAGNLPGWVIDSDKESVDWINFTYVPCCWVPAL